MGRLNGTLLRYLEKEDFRVLTAVEMGQKNHEIVPLKLIASISGVREGAAFKVLGKLSKHRLTAYEAGKNFDGYRLTILGYDYLALNSLVKQGAVYGLGSQVGVGKESDIYLVSNEAGEEMILKLARLGRTSFRQLKNKRDYHRHRQSASWLYLSRLAAELEFTYMKKLYDSGFPVPIPIAYSRHAVLMSVAEGFPLCQIDELNDPAELCSRLIDILCKLASCGLIHGDFNEFNLMVGDEDEDDEDEDGGKITVIDFPQMVSINHRNAEYYFDRDVACVRDFFAKKFGYIHTNIPKLSDIKREKNFDEELKASGYNHHLKTNNISDVAAVEHDDDEEEKVTSGESEEHQDSDSHSNEEEEQEPSVSEYEDDDKPSSRKKSAIGEIRSIVRKQVRKQRSKQTNRVILQSAMSTSARERRKYGRASDLCTEDFFVKLLED